MSDKNTLWIALLIFGLPIYLAIKQAVDNRKIRESRLKRLREEIEAKEDAKSSQQRPVDEKAQS